MKTQKIVGIICEYNPFHNGHAYQINEIRERGYDTVVCVMSGNTVQRGEFAITDKYTRAKCALYGGADLVIELPYPYSSAGAEYFASAGVELISSIGADAICFGSECGSAETIKKAAEVCLSEEFENEYKKLSNSAIGTAGAYFEAFKSLTGTPLPTGANDILGIAYYKAIIKKGIPLRAEIIKREGSDYRDSVFSYESSDIFPSASMIREEILKNGVSDFLDTAMPQKIYDIMKAAKITRELSVSDKSVLSYFRLCDPGLLASSDILEAGGGIAEKLCKMSHKVHSCKELVEMTAGKKYPHARIKRAILHCMIGATLTDAKRKPAFSTVLGFNERGRAILSSLRHSSCIPLLTKPADASDISSEAQRQSLLSLKADALFTLSAPDICKSSEYITRSPIIV